MSNVLTKEFMVAELIRIQGEMDAIADSPSYTYDAWRAKQLEYINVSADLASYNWQKTKRELGW